MGGVRQRRDRFWSIPYSVFEGYMGREPDLPWSQMNPNYILYSIQNAWKEDTRDMLGTKARPILEASNFASTLHSIPLGYLPCRVFPAKYFTNAVSSW